MRLPLAAMAAIALAVGQVRIVGPTMMTAYNGVAGELGAMQGHALSAKQAVDVLSASQEGCPQRRIGRTRGPTYRRHNCRTGLAPTLYRTTQTRDRRKPEEN